ncbi:glycosyltransferase family 2 protein [Thermosulfuriphilus sp.]
MPKVAVVIPCYNAETFIPKTLESVLAQDFPDYEIIVVDDGSTDSTRAILQEYNRLSNLKIIHQSNAGPAQSRNTGIKASDSDYIAFLDSDDLWHPFKLRQQVEILDNNPGVGLCYTGAQVIDLSGKRLPQRDRKTALPVFNSHRRALEALMVENFIVTSSVLIRRGVLEKTGLFSDQYLYAEDWDLWLRIAKGFPIFGIPEALCLYRWHEKSFSSKRIALLESSYKLTRRSLSWLSSEGRSGFLEKRLLRRLGLIASDIGKLYLKEKKRTSALRWQLKSIRHLPTHPKPWLRLLKVLLLPFDS